MQKITSRLALMFATVVVTLLIFPATAFATTWPVAVDSTSFPDSVWREYVNTNYAGGDYSLTQAEAESVMYIAVPNKGITDLSGIEYFIYLPDLYCQNNSLTELDLSGNPYLVYFGCQNNSLTELNLTGCTDLFSLECQNNSLTELDITTNSNLYFFDCRNNSLLDIVGTRPLLNLSATGQERNISMALIHQVAL